MSPLDFTGTTWTQEMVWLLMNNLDYDTAKKEKLVDRSPYMEYSCLISKEETELFGVRDTVKIVESMKSPRCIKSHLSLELFPEELRTVKPKDLPAVVLRMANFLECSISAEQLKKLCEHFSFESMKKNPMTNFESDMNPAIRSYLEGKVEPFMRKGQVGGWKSDLTPQIAQKIDKWTEERLKNTDYVLHI
ncbi:hypothetical protein C0J52_08332 [Blattella germanica]|nr:hypothetical protein C0J52_08332 [Blattella germanica]